MGHTPQDPPPPPPDRDRPMPGDADDAAPTIDLDALRVEIDTADRVIIDALSRRARIVVDIGRSKRSSGTPIYAPHRERQVLDRILALNEGPLSDRTVEAIYRELMSGSFSLEQPLRIAFLAPDGSFSHLAAQRHFGSSVEHVGVHTIEHVFEEVAAGRCQYGLVPYENSTSGGITDTLDAFPHHEVTVYAEAMILVQHCLLTNVAAADVRRIASKPQIFNQCRHWLSQQYPGAELVPMTSSSAAVQWAAEQQDAAAIGSQFAGAMWGVNMLYEGIEDKANNVTRFLVLSKEETLASGDDKTTFMFVTAHRPGALADVLVVFRDAGVNLSHIDKRPSQDANWEYMFFADADGHQSEPAMAKALEDARQHCVLLRVLGSYPRAGQVL